MSILLVELPGFVCSARTPVERLFCRQQKLTSFLQGLPFLRQSIGGGPGRLFRAARLPLLQPQLMQKTRGALTGAACRSPLCRRTWLDSGGVRFGDRNGGACIKFCRKCHRRKPGAILHTSSVPGTFCHPRSLRAGSSRGQLNQLSFTASAFVVYLVAPTPTEVDPRAEAPKWDWHIPDSKFWGSHNRVFAL